MPNTSYAAITPFAFSYGKPIQVLRVGRWNFPDYGEVEVTKDDIAQYVDNFKKNVRRTAVPINIEHNKDLGAVGWVQDMYANDDGTAAFVVPEWTPKGDDLIKNDAFRYTSPELYRYYEDPELGTVTQNVMSGVAVTNYPRFKEMLQIAASEGDHPIEVIRLAELEKSAPVLDWIDEVFADLPDNATKAQIHDALLMANMPQHVRDNLADSTFAFPKQRKEPLNDADHVRAAIGRFNQVQGVSDGERDEAWGRIKRAAKKFGITVSQESWRDLGKKKGAANMADVDPDSNTHGDMTTDGHSHGDYASHSHDGDNSHSGAPKKKSANMSEPTATLFAEMQTRISAAEAKVTELSEQNATLQRQYNEQHELLMAERQRRVAVEVNDALLVAQRQGRINKALADAYREKLVKMSDEARTEWLNDITSRPAALPMGETGNGTEATVDPEGDTHDALADRQMQIFNEAARAGKPVTAKEALHQAAREFKAKGLSV